MTLRDITPGVLALAACCCFAQTPAEGEGAPAEREKPESSVAPSPTAPVRIDTGGAIVIADSAPYADTGLIAENILKECVALGRQFSDATQMHGTEQGLKIEKVASVDPAKHDQALALTIVAAISAGSPFTGHRKSVSIRADLYKSGKLHGSYRTTRNSMGGVFAGFKSSCDVLERTVDTLGSDVARWLKKGEFAVPRK